ncbi:MAG: DNRLRE domain-containing protein [Verrucomicrobiae bacterium]|nr:DNRLRE domain-containing protein [Verrucomicrobiae bacterium]
MNAIHKITRGSLMAAFLAAAAGPVAGQTYTFREGLSGYTGTSDNGLYSFSTLRDDNTGANALLSIGDASTDGTDKRRTILRFDVSSLPVDALVTSATLTLTKEESSMQRSFTFGVYQIADTNAGWIEGATVFATAATGESDWNHKAHGVVGGGWVGSAGLSLAGVDYLTPALASNILYDVGDTNSITDQNGVGINITLPASLVNYWHTNINAGLLLISDVEASGVNTYNQQFASAEHGNATWRPTLTLVTIPEPSTVMLLGASLVLVGRACRRR